MTTLTEEQTKILDAALREFELHGFSGTSMETIATTANIPKRAIYRHYLDKESILDAIVDMFKSLCKEQPTTPYSPNFPIHAQFSELVLNLFHNFNDKEKIRLTRIILPELVRRPELTKALPSIVTKKQFPSFPSFLWIKEAIMAGGLRQADSTVAFLQLIALIRSTTLWPMLVEGREPLNETKMQTEAEQVVDFFLAYYKAEGR